MESSAPSPAPGAAPSSASSGPAPRAKRGSRTGFTTGACAAAAAKAATRAIVCGSFPESIETTLPNRATATFRVHRAERTRHGALCSVIKDAGDDPDCTHGAELVAEVVLRGEAGVKVLGGAGVATVTKPGLGLEVGSSAINPVPRRNIREMVDQELVGSEYRGATVTVCVPGGEAMAANTTNARLGLVGGISILGTSGIVRPYSTAAFRASVVQELDVAHAGQLSEVVLTTGGKSERYAMALHPHLEPAAFIQVGDFVGVGLRHAQRCGLERATIVGMVGKLSKMAMGKMQTHVAGSQVDTEFLARVAAECGATAELQASILEANTARHVLELCSAAGLTGLPTALCERVTRVAEEHVAGVAPKASNPRAASLAVHALLTDFGGTLLGRFPPVAEERGLASLQTPRTRR